MLVRFTHDARREFHALPPAEREAMNLRELRRRAVRAAEERVDADAAKV